MKKPLLWFAHVIRICCELTEAKVSLSLFPLVALTIIVQGVIEYQRPAMCVGVLLCYDSGVGVAFAITNQLWIGVIENSQANAYEHQHQGKKQYCSAHVV